MRLVVTQDGVAVEFVEPGVDGAYPWLSDVGNLRLAARAGHISGTGVGENANVAFALDNTERQAAMLLGRPVRAQAVLYDDAGDEFFRGLIQGVEYGSTLRATIEA